MVDIHTIIHTAVLCILLWLLVRHRRDMRDLGRVLQTVLETQAVFRPAVEQMQDRLEDVWESQAARATVMESHQSQERMLKEILERLS